MELRSAIMGLRKEGHQIDVRVSLQLQSHDVSAHCLLQASSPLLQVGYESADTERYVKEMLGMGDVDVLVAAGGDGSINEARCHAPSQLLPWKCVLTRACSGRSPMHWSSWTLPAACSWPSCPW